MISLCKQLSLISKKWSSCFSFHAFLSGTSFLVHYFEPPFSFIFVSPSFTISSNITIVPSIHGSPSSAPFTSTYCRDVHYNSCETKVWLIMILMITKQGLKLMIIFQVWLGKTTSKVAIQRQIKSRRNHEEEDHLKEKSFSRPKLLRISL